MDTPRERARSGANEAQEGVLTTPDGHALPRVLDPAVTMDLVQRYVETERVKSRRTLVVAGTLFLFIVLVLLTVFTAIGIYVLRNSRRATQMAAELRDETIGYTVEMVNISNRVDGLTRVQKDVKNEVQKAEASRNRESQFLKSDLERFSKWVAEKDARKARSLAELDDLVRKMQEESAAKEQEIKAMKEQYATLLARVAGPAPGKPEPALDEKRSPPARDEPDQGLTTSGTGPTTAAAEGAEGETVIEPAGGHQGEISVVTFPSGDRYEGEFRDGLMSGWGTYFYRSGDKYEGEFRHDMKSGKGTLTYRNGDKYLGEFKDDMKNGRGSYLFRNGDKYVGEFKNDMISGKGTMLYHNGNKYAGDLRNGLKHGNGVFRFANGDVYEGEFKDDIREGRGTYAFSDGTKYIGDFGNGQRHGKGRYIYAGGEEYVGEFRNGKKDGNGVCIYPNGKRLNGLWKEDKLVRTLDG